MWDGFGRSEEGFNYIPEFQKGHKNPHRHGRNWRNETWNVLKKRRNKKQKLNEILKKYVHNWIVYFISRNSFFVHEKYDLSLCQTFFLQLTLLYPLSYWLFLAKEVILIIKNALEISKPCFDFERIFPKSSWERNGLNIPSNYLNIQYYKLYENLMSQMVWVLYLLLSRQVRTPEEDYFAKGYSRVRPRNVQQQKEVLLIQQMCKKKQESNLQESEV